MNNQSPKAENPHSWKTAQYIFHQNHNTYTDVTYARQNPIFTGFGKTVNIVTYLDKQASQITHTNKNTSGYPHDLPTL